MAEVVAGIEAAIIAFRTLQSAYQDVADRYANFVTNRSRIELCDEHVRAMDQRLTLLSNSFSQVSPLLTPAAQLVWHAQLSDISACLRNVAADATQLASLLPPSHNTRDVDLNFSAVQNTARKILSTARAFTSANDVASRVADLNAQLAHLRQKTFDCIDRLDSKHIGLAAAAAASTSATALQHSISANLNPTDQDRNLSSPAFAPCPTATIPPLHGDTLLRFDDEASCEGRLYNALLSSMPSIPSSQSSGSLSSLSSSVDSQEMPSVLVALGVSGMGGVGKSTALIGLAHHPTVQALFPDGVYFMTLGKDAGEREVVYELAGIVAATGGHLVDDTDSATNVQRAVQATVEWFQGRRVLFIVDDVWASGTSRPVGYIPELKRLLACSSHCRLLCSTRSHTIAEEAGTPVPFASRDPTGLEARTMFLKYADIPFDSIYGCESNSLLTSTSIASSACSSTQQRSAKYTPHARPVVDDILLKCCGVPLTIGVAGRGVRRYLRSNTNTTEDEYYNALKSYRDDLYAHGYNVSEEALGNYPNFRFAVDISLDLAQRALDQRLMSSSFSAKVPRQRQRPQRLMDPPTSASMPSPQQRPHHHQLTHLFRKLCVLGKARRVPIDVLTRLWPGLVKRHCLLLVYQLIDLNLVICAKGQKASNHTYGLHDLVHDYCESSARDDGVYETYHSEFLDSFKPKPAPPPRYSDIDGEMDDDDSENSTDDSGVNSHDDDDIFNDIDVEDYDDDEESRAEDEIPDFVYRVNIDEASHAWWNQAPTDNVKEYLFANIARHLRESNRIAELIALLSSLQWVAVRTRRGHGGIIALAADFDVLISFLTEHPFAESDQLQQILSDVTMLRNAVRTFWPYVSRNPIELRTQAYARLLGVGGWLVRRFLASAPAPPLLPLHRYWPVPSTRDDARLSVHGPVTCVAAIWGQSADLRMSRKRGHVDGSGERAVAAVGRDLVFIDLASLTSVVSWNAHDWQIDAVVWAARANVVVSASSHDGQIKTWDAATKRIHSFKLQPDLNSEQRCSILSLDCDAHASRIVFACSAFPSLRMWVSYQRKWAKWPSMLFPESVQHPALSAAISDDGKRIAVGVADGSVLVMQADSGALIIGAGNIGCPLLIAHRLGVHSIALLSDGRRGISASPDEVLVWNVDELSTDAHTDAVIRLPNMKKSSVRTVALSADGGHAVVAWKDGCVRVHRVEAGTVAREACGTLHHERGVRALISPDGSAVLSVAERDRTVRLWNAGPDRNSGLPPTAHKQKVRTVHIGQGGRVAVSACRGGEVRLWDLVKFHKRKQQHGAIPVNLVDCAINIPVNDTERTEPSQRNHSAPIPTNNTTTSLNDLIRNSSVGCNGTGGKVLAAAVNHDGTRVVIAKHGSDVHILDCSSLLCTSNILQRKINSSGTISNRRGSTRGSHRRNISSTNANTKHMRRASASESCDPDENVTAANISGGDCGQAMYPPGTSPAAAKVGDKVQCVSTCSTGRTIVCGTTDGVVRVWRGRTCVSEIKKHAGGVMAVDVSSDGRYVGCAARNGKVRLWDKERNTCTTVDGHHGIATCVSVSGDGRRMVSGGYDCTVRVWDIHNDDDATPSATASGDRGRKNVRATVLGDQDGVVRAVAVSECGKVIVGGGMDCMIKIWTSKCGKKKGSSAGKWECQSYSVAAEVFSVAITRCPETEKTTLLCGLANGQVLLHELHI